MAYSAISEALDVENVRDLEDAVIETIYAGLVSGKMDQMKREFRVSKAAGRDVRLEEVGAMADKLEAWAATADTLSDSLEANKRSAKAMRDARSGAASALEAKVEEAKKALKDGGDADGRDAMDVDRPKRRGKRSRMPFKGL